MLKMNFLSYRGNLHNFALHFIKIFNPHLVENDDSVEIIGLLLLLIFYEANWQSVTYFFALRYTVHFDVAVREVGEEDIGYRNYGGKRGKIEFRNQLEVQLRRAERNRFRGLFKFRLRRGRLNSNRRIRAILLIAGVSRASFLVVFWNQIAKFFVFYVFWLASTFKSVKNRK